MNSNITQLPLEKGKLIGEKYKVGEKQGRGGACDVYMVTQLGLDVPRVLKMLRPENADKSLFMRTFQIEIKLLSELTHKNVIKILDAGSFQSHPERIVDPDFDYYIMEFVGTGSLKDFPLKDQNDANDLLVIFDQLFDGLVYIHARDILHFDIKPTNIMVWRDESRKNLEAKISDLGTAIPLKPGTAVQLLLKEKPADTTHTYAFGTSKYLPEYARKFLNKLFAIVEARAPSPSRSRLLSVTPSASSDRTTNGNASSVIVSSPVRRAMRSAICDTIKPLASSFAKTAFLNGAICANGPPLSAKLYFMSNSRIRGSSLLLLSQTCPSARTLPSIPKRNRYFLRGRRGNFVLIWVKAFSSRLKFMKSTAISSFVGGMFCKHPRS